MIIFASSVVLLSNAQEYKNGIGVRLGSGSGFTFKHFMNSRSAIEGMLTTRWHGFEMTALYEKQADAFDTKGLQWFYGFGAHLGFYNGRYVEWGEPGSTTNALGIDGILGLEYTFADAPVNLGFDIKPAMNIIGYNGFYADYALSVRFIF